jgi:hypothetical protein
VENFDFFKNPEEYKNNNNNNGNPSNSEMTYMIKCLNNNPEYFYIVSFVDKEILIPLVTLNILLGEPIGYVSNVYIDNFCSKKHNEDGIEALITPKYNAHLFSIPEVIYSKAELYSVTRTLWSMHYLNI